MPLFSIAEHKRWCDLSYDEAKDLAIEAKAFRERKNWQLSRNSNCFLEVSVFAFLCCPNLWYRYRSNIVARQVVNFRARCHYID